MSSLTQEKTAHSPLQTYHLHLGFFSPEFHIPVASHAHPQKLCCSVNVF